MLPVIRRLVDVELMRDGGSYAATYESDLGRRYIIFLKVDERSVSSPTGPIHGEPVLIDCAPELRPPDTDRVVHSQLSGPATAVTVQEARDALSAFSSLAGALSPLHASWLRELQGVLAKMP